MAWAPDSRTTRSSPDVTHWRHQRNQAPKTPQHPSWIRKRRILPQRIYNWGGAAFKTCTFHRISRHSRDPYEALTIRSNAIDVTENRKVSRDITKPHHLQEDAARKLNPEHFTGLRQQTRKFTSPEYRYCSLLFDSQLKGGVRYVEMISCWWWIRSGKSG